MKSLFNTLKKNKSNNESEVMKAILIKIWDYYGFNYKYLDFSYELIEHLRKSEIYESLEKLDNEIWKDEYLLVRAYEFIVNRKKQEKFSIYYTPKWLVSYITKGTLVNIDIENIHNIKILEPACGSGSFLIYTFDFLFNIYSKNKSLNKLEIIKKIIENNLYGVDIDKEALKFCEYSLKIKILKKLNYLPDISMNLFKKDYLIKEFFNKIKFDYIIGNPPYLENRRINKYFDKKYLKKNYLTAIGRFDIYSLFIEKSLNLLKDKGVLGFVLPASLFSNNNFYETRKLILNKSKINELINLGEHIFEDVGMNMAIIIISKSNNKNNLIKCKSVVGIKDKKKNINNKYFRYINQKYYYNIIKNVFDINSNERTFKLRERIYYDNYIKINDVCEIVAGIATGNIRNKLLVNEKKNKNAKKVLRGKDVDYYIHTWSSLYIIDDKSIIDKNKGEYATFMRKEFITKEKILIRQTANRFICTYDSCGYYLLNTLYSLIIRDEYNEKLNIKYILALLNSKFYSFLYRSLIREKGKLFPQLKIFHIQSSPIKLISLKKQETFIKHVDNILNIKEEKLNAGLTTESDIRGREIKKSLNKIDSLVYELFNLTREEINEVELEMDK
ncbi:MAG: hypothetical protein FH751_05770 [Firmicutes bacterium]|nr:hypothetical protein [Bacillota bacterium]